MITIEPPSTQAASGGIRIQSRTLGKAELQRFVARAAAIVGLKGEVHVLLSDDAALRRLNKLFRKKDKATDVLSFPVADSSAGVAGDLAISLETAARQAHEHNHTLKEEVRVLLLHGVLHLAGYDHEADQGEMAARERALRAELGLPVGLIERAGGIRDVRKRASSKPVSSKRVGSQTADSRPVGSKAVSSRAASKPARKKT